MGKTTTSTKEQCTIHNVRQRNFMRQAIEVMYSHNRNTAFIIEGFERKRVDAELLESKILKHFERLYGVDNVEIRQVLKDFLVKTKDNEWAITWSWVTSYVA